MTELTKGDRVRVIIINHSSCFNGRLGTIFAKAEYGYYAVHLDGDEEGINTAFLRSELYKLKELE